MKSLRLRLALISTAISGVVIAGFGLAGWFLTDRILQESIDLRLSVPLDRIVRDLHPRTDLERVIANLEIGFGDDVADGTHRVLLLDRDGSEIYRAPDDDWVAAIDPAVLVAQVPVMNSERIRRPEEQEADGIGQFSEREWEQFLTGINEGAGEPGNQRPPPRSDHERPGDRDPEHRGPPLQGKGRDRREPPPVASGPPRLAFSTLSEGSRQWRIGVVEDRGYIALMGTDLSGYLAEVREIRRLFFLAFPICLLIIGLGGWFVARRALRPVDLIARTASRVTAHGLDRRIPKGVDDYEELSHLVDVLNGMMDRLEGSFQHAMRFSADVSHELKTPLAVMQVAVQDALKDCRPGSKEEESLLTVSHEAERLKRITRSLMLLAQADAGQLAVHEETFSLSREVEAVCEDAEILCEEAGLDFEADIEPDLEATTDPTLLRQAMQNLVSNAVKYNRPDGSVSCRLFRFDDAGETVFEVSNTGPGIDENEQEKIFERFYRVDRSRSRDVDGFGLGLNLAGEIVRAVGGDLQLVESSDEITRFQLRLPTDKPGAK